MRLPVRSVNRWPGGVGLRCAIPALGLLLCVAAPMFAQKSEVQEESRHEKDDPRARAEYLERKSSGGQPIPRGARLSALGEQQRMMEREGADYWQKQAEEALAQAAAEKAATAPESGAARPERLTPAPAPSASQWVSIGPTPANPNPINPGGGNHFSGRVTAMVTVPSSNTVYLGGAQGGVWKSTDAGATWTALTDTQASLATGSIVLDPQNSQIIYVGTGEENFGLDNYYGVGVLKSTNGGGSWTLVAGSTAFSNIQEPECTGLDIGIQGMGGGCGGLRIGGMAASNQSGTTVLLAAVQGGHSNTGGLYRSTNGGGMWQLVLGTIPTVNGLRYTADSVVFANSLTAYAGIHRQGIYKSTDGGATFNSANGTGMSITNTARVSLAPATSDATGNTVYAALEDSNSSTLSGLYKTINGGTTWTKLTNVPDFCGAQGNNFSQQCFYDMMVAVSPTNANLVFVGGAGYPLPQFVLHSTDGGSTWINDSTDIHADQHAGAFTSDGATFYIGNDGGAYKTSSIGNGAVTWAELNSTLNLTQFYGYFAIDPANSGVAYGGTQDNGTQKFSGKLEWDEVTCGDGAGAVIDSNSTRVFTNCDLVDVRQSPDGSPGSFGSNNSGGGGLNANDRSLFIPPMVGDSLNPLHLYLGTCRVWRATSANTLSWTAITNDLSAANNGSSCPANVTQTHNITNMEASADSSVLYVVTDDGKVQRITNPASAPIVTDVTGSGFPSGNYINAIRVSRTNANTAYIAIAGFASGQHIFKTTTGGGPWTNISSDLPNTPVNDLVIDPDLPSTLYAATDIGVFVSTNDGGHWATLQTLLPKVAVLGLRLHQQSRTLRAATHGRGMWDLYVPACGNGPCVALGPTFLNFGSQNVGTSSGVQTITITNSGNSNLVVNGITVTGQDYLQTNNCGTVAQNGTCTISVTFTPTGALTRNGSITIYSNAGNPTVAGLTGVGRVLLGNDDSASGITVTNLPYDTSMVTNGASSQSTDPVPSSACITFYAPNSLGLNPTDPQGYDPAPTFNHHSLWFNYTPSASGTVNINTLNTSFDTVLSVWTGNPGSFVAAGGTSCNDDTTDTQGNATTASKLTGMPVTGGTTYHIMVTGYYADTGTLVFHMDSATTPPLKITPAVMNFVSILNRASAPQTVTIQNLSGSSKNITNMTASGDYALTQNNCIVTLANTASCTAQVTFTPVSTGQRNGVLTITDTAAGSPQTVPLNGAGFDFNLMNPRPHRSSRNGGIISGQRQEFEVTLQTEGPGNVAVSLGCANVPPGATCTVSPSEVMANDGSTPVTVSLQTSAAGQSGGGRTARLGNQTTPAGSYNLQITARIGDAVRTTVIPVTVTAPPRASRLGH